MGSGVTVFLCAQVLVEFWAVATRPKDVNGLGWSTTVATRAIAALREQFPLLEDRPDALDCWLELVSRCQVSGKRSHDARLAGLMHAHGVRQIVTFNTADFPADWGVEAVDPEAIGRGAGL